MQPRHCAPDITGQWAKAVGPARWKYAWAFRSLRDAGVVLAFSSDWNVAEMEPLIGIYTALTRKGLDGKPEGGWVPAQTIDLDTAIRAYTINGAFANFVEQNRGSITPGKYPTWSCCRMICSKFQQRRSRTRILCGRWWEEKPCGANNRQRFFR